MSLSRSTERPLLRGAIVAVVTVLVIGAALVGTTRPWEPAPSASPSPAVASPSASPTCPAVAELTHSIARRWDEALLDAIRRALPNPPVHARNLYHLSVAMWDAWAAYDPTARGVLYTTKVSTAGLQSAGIEAARREAISYAAYSVLSHRFENAVGGDDSLAEFQQVMADLCYPIEALDIPREDAATLGDRIGTAVIEHGLADGS